MSKKQTPYQYSQGLTYVKQVPTFLQDLTSGNSQLARASRAIASERLRLDDSEDEAATVEYEEEDPEQELDGAEAPQIVVLREGRHMSEQEVREHLDKKAGRDDGAGKDEEKVDAANDRPAFDEDTGRLLFRRPKKKPVEASRVSVGSATAPSKSGNDKRRKSKDGAPTEGLQEVIDGMKRARDDGVGGNDDGNDMGKVKKKAKKKAAPAKTLLSFEDDV